MSQSEIVIRNCRDEFPRVVEAVIRFASEHELSRDVTNDLQVALDEILSNIVDYGYTDGADHPILIRLRVSDAMLEATIEDDGIAFNPLESRAPVVKGALHERRIGGLGIHFVKQLINEVVYNRVSGRNRLILKKKLAM